MTKIICFTILIFLLTTRATLSAESARSYLAKAAEYQRRDPFAEAQENFRKGDIYIFSAMGVGRYFPGIEDHRIAERIEKKYGVKCLGGTSDAVKSKAHLAYMEAATKFASAYNKQTVMLITGKDRSR